MFDCLGICCTQLRPFANCLVFNRNTKLIKHEWNAISLKGCSGTHDSHLINPDPHRVDILYLFSLYVKVFTAVYSFCNVLPNCGEKNEQWNHVSQFICHTVLPPTGKCYANCVSIISQSLWVLPQITASA